MRKNKLLFVTEDRERVNFVCSEQAGNNLQTISARINLKEKRSALDGNGAILAAGGRRRHSSPVEQKIQWSQVRFNPTKQMRATRPMNKITVGCGLSD